MLILYLVAAAFIVILLAIKGGLLLAMPIGILLLLGSIWVKGRVELYQTKNRLRLYAKQVDNIYVFSLDEYDTEVVQRATQEKKWLLEANNRTEVQVICFFYQDAANCNENWEQFVMRAETAIQEDRVRRHSLVSDKYREFYIINALNQTV